MSSPSPPVLPVSSNQNAITTTVGEPQLPVPTPAFRSFINHLADSIRQGLSQRRPWPELIDRAAFSKPESISEAAIRIRKNYTYFRVNYLASIALILAFSLISHPFSLLLLLGLLAAWLFLYLFRPSDPPLVMFGRTFTERETLGILVLLSVVVVFLTSVGSVLISALMVGSAIVCAHGAFKAPEDLFLDEQEPIANGFLSYFTGAAFTAATATAPVVPPRV